MKGYKFQGKERKKNFIERYEIKDGKIYLHMASGEKLEYDYSDEFLQTLVNRQEESYTENNSRLTRKYKDLLRCYGMLDSGSAFLGALALIPVCFVPTAIVPLVISFLLFGTSFFAYFKTKEYKKALKELEKQGFFLENKELFKDSVVENKNITQCLGRAKTKEMKSQIEKTGSAFNLSSIDNLSLAQLKELKTNIEREQQFQKLSNQGTEKDNSRQFKMYTLK